MYSYAGPVIAVPSGFFRTGKCGRRRVARQGREVVLPATADHRVAAWPQERVVERRGIGDRDSRIVSAGAAVERLERLAAAVRRLVHHLVTALAEIDRLQDVEIVLVDDATLIVHRRELDVGDDGVQRIVRVDLSGGDARDLLVLADTGERVAAESDRSRCDFDLRRASVRSGCRRKHAGCERRGNAKLQQRPFIVCRQAFEGHVFLHCNHFCCSLIGCRTAVTTRQAPALALIRDE